MHSKLAFVGGLVAASLLAVACGSTGTSGTGPYGSQSAAPVASPAATSPSANPTPVAAGTVITVTNTRLGTVLTDGSGRTVYLFVADKGTASVCYTTCAQYWPPVLTTGTPQAGTGATSSLLGTTARTDGTTQVTYNGHPLYYFVSDKQTGDVTGQAVNAFGGPWYVVSPAGMQIG